jgi:thiosulfate dehydrogenase
MIKGIVVGFIVTVIVLGGGVYFYFASGMAPVATADPMMPFERQMANMALKAHIEKQHIGKSPVAVDESNLLAGAEVYKKECAICHGLPDHPAEYANMMFPKPPQLFKGKGVTDDPVSESYWKVANGIRLSAMPSFKTNLTDTQLWQVSQVVAHAKELPESAKQVLVPDGPMATSPHEGRK